MKPICLILLLALGLSGCSSFSKSARQQRAYEKYVHKSMAQRSKQRAKISKNQAHIPESETGPVHSNMDTVDDSQPMAIGQTDQ